MSGEFTETAVRQWLRGYAWLGSDRERAAEVECIMAQGEWQHLSARVEQLLAQRSGERSIAEDVDDAVGYALSGLYECHTEPHLGTCPRWKEREEE
jgi:hypothetical protein